MIIDEPSAPRKSLGRRALPYVLTLLGAAVVIYGLSVIVH